MSLIDIIQLNKAVVEIIELNEQQTANADCYFDGVIDVKDVEALMKFIVELKASLPYVD